MRYWANEMASYYCEHKDGCGNLLDDINSVCAYYRKDGTMVPKKICKDCTTRLTTVRHTLEKSHPRPPSGSKCQICKRVSKLNLDHCHSSEKFRGWLCQSCNLACGLLGDNSTNVRAALEYMETFEKSESSSSKNE